MNDSTERLNPPFGHQMNNSAENPIYKITMTPDNRYTAAPRHQTPPLEGVVIGAEGIPEKHPDEKGIPLPDMASPGDFEYGDYLKPKPEDEEELYHTIKDEEEEPYEVMK